MDQHIVVKQTTDP